MKPKRPSRLRDWLAPNELKDNRLYLLKRKNAKTLSGARFHLDGIDLKDESQVEVRVPTDAAGSKWVTVTLHWSGGEKEPPRFSVPLRKAKNALIELRAGTVMRPASAPVRSVEVVEPATDSSIWLSRRKRDKFNIYGASTQQEARTSLGRPEKLMLKDSMLESGMKLKLMTRSKLGLPVHYIWCGLGFEDVRFLTQVEGSGLCAVSPGHEAEFEYYGDGRYWPGPDDLDSGLITHASEAMTGTWMLEGRDGEKAIFRTNDYRALFKESKLTGRSGKDLHLRWVRRNMLSLGDVFKAEFGEPKGQETPGYESRQNSLQFKPNSDEGQFLRGVTHNLFAYTARRVDHEDPWSWMGHMDKKAPAWFKPRRDMSVE